MSASSIDLRGFAAGKNGPTFQKQRTLTRPEPDAADATVHDDLRRRAGSDVRRARTGAGPTPKSVQQLQGDGLFLLKSGKVTPRTAYL